MLTSKEPDLFGCNNNDLVFYVLSCSEAAYGKHGNSHIWFKYFLTLFFVFFYAQLYILLNSLHRIIMNLLHCMELNLFGVFGELYSFCGIELALYGNSEKLSFEQKVEHYRCFKF